MDHYMDPNLDPNLIGYDTMDPDTMSPDTTDLDPVDANQIDPNLIDPRIIDPNIAEANAIARIILTKEEVEQWTTAQLELQSLQAGQEYFTYPNIQETLRDRFWETEVECDDMLKQQVECYPWPRALLRGDENFHKHEGGIDGCPDSKTLIFMNYPYRTSDRSVLFFLKTALGVNHTEVVAFRFRCIGFHRQSMFLPLPVPSLRKLSIILYTRVTKHHTLSAPNSHPTCRHCRVP